MPVRCLFIKWLISGLISVISKLGSIEERGLTISRIEKGLRIFKDNMRWKLQNNLPDMADVVGVNWVKQRNNAGICKMGTNE